MKSFLLSAALLLSASATVLAQGSNLPPDYRWEIGLNGGLSPNSTTKGVAQEYRGTKGSTNAVLAIKANYNLTENWQIGAELSTTKWMASANWAQTDAYGQSLSSKKVTFNIADPSINLVFHLNHMIPFYSIYTHYNKANFYYGIAGGLVTTVNDGGITYSTYNQAPDPKYVYTSKYDYSYGIGYTAGVQVGYEYYILPGFGLNVELAGRYADVGTNDTRYAHENARYGIFYFPCTVGLRFRF